MSFLFGFLDMLLIIIMLFDTLGLIYLFRKKETVSPDEYNRVCFSWILFLIIYNIFSCSWTGFFGTLFRLIFFAAKAYVTIPKLGGATKLHKILIEQDQAKQYFSILIFYVLSIFTKKKELTPEEQKEIDELLKKPKEGGDFLQSETVEPESNPGNNDIANQENI